MICIYKIREKIENEIEIARVRFLIEFRLTNRKTVSIAIGIKREKKLW